jgi:hypothetical protein
MSGPAPAEAPEERRRRLARQRTAAHRERRSRGGVVVPVEVSPRHVRALERLALLGAGERARAAVGAAVGRFLEAAPHVAAMGDALWPEGEGSAETRRLFRLWGRMLRGGRWWEPVPGLPPPPDHPGWQAYRERRGGRFLRGGRIDPRSLLALCDQARYLGERRKGAADDVLRHERAAPGDALSDLGEATCWSCCEAPRKRQCFATDDAFVDEPGEAMIGIALHESVQK